MTPTELKLPEGARGLVAKANRSWVNAGLQLDKLSCGGDQQSQGTALANVSECSGDRRMLAELRERRHAVLDDLAALRLQGRTMGPLTLHLSRAGALENAGIALHPIYGFAWLPGTGLKGLTRAWAETVWASAPEQADKAAAWSKIRAVFGTSPQSDRGKGWLPASVSPPAEDFVGRIVFHDAWPTDWPKLVRDIVNNHHTKYYQGKGNDHPVDWEDPVPVNFLAVEEGTIFDFAVSDRASDGDGLAELAKDWLVAALMHAGTGAKTVAGYGRIAPVSEDRPAAPRSLLRSEHRLELVSPAFLAGAAQGESDCDLRPATLRGLMRWWWRTMHAGHLRAADLAKLEALVWGDTESGSPVSISLEPKTRAAPQPYDKDEIRRRHKLESPRGRKNPIQGLYYTSYGMDERSRGALRRRSYLDSGAKWNLVLTARDGFWGNKQAVPAKLIVEQAEAALWLLATFGGAGSKSRKGFGSFANVDVHSTRSINDCMEVAKRLREYCGLRSLRAVRRSRTPALECCIQTKEISTHWRDPWYALDKVGAVYQRYIKDQCRKGDRVVFGLPRRRQSLGRGQALEGKNRYASPVHWSLGRHRDGNLWVRLIAFPALDLLPTSESVLDGLKSFVEEELQREVQQTPGKGQAAAPTRGLTQSRTPNQGLPSVGSLVRVRLRERTKNSWRVESADGSMKGHIGNAQEMSGEFQEGQELDLLVTRASATEAVFRWPPEPDKVKAAKPADSKPKRQRSRHRGRRRKR